MKETEENQIDMVIWDLETTGFVAPESKILEIGCLIIRGDQIEEKHWVLDNKCEIPEKITEITGITKAIIDAEGKDPASCMNEFLPILKLAKVNITHNGIKFDIPFLIEYSADLFGWTPIQKSAVTKMIKDRSFDTAVHVKAKKLNLLQKETESFLDFATRIMNIRAFGVKYSLGLCCDEMGIDMSNIKLHRALGDVAMTHEVYKKLTFKKDELEITS